MKENGLMSNTPTTAEAQPEQDYDIYELLSNKRRRYIVHYLKQRPEETVAVNDVTEQVAAWENDKPVEQLNAQERKRVHISLYQSHLPRLDEEGVIEYDDDADQVSVSESLGNIEVYLEVVSEQNIPWSQFYFGLALVFGALIAVVQQEIGVLKQDQLLLVAVAMTLILAASATVQQLRQSRTKLGDEGPPPELLD